MAQVGSITVYDGKAVPLAHVFTRQEVVPGQATFVEAAAVPAGNKKITIRWRTGENKRRYRRVMITAPVLVVETINGVSVPRVVRTNLFDGNIRTDENSTQDERDDLIAMFASVINGANPDVDKTLAGDEAMW